MTDLIGTVVNRVAFDVERGKIREFARVGFEPTRRLTPPSGFQVRQ
jgi:hypothetical protein